MCWCGDPCKTPPPLCDFEQWIDTEIKPQNKERLEYMRQWDAERKEKIEQRRKEEAAEKEHKAEAERRRVAAYREERERKLERARRAKAAMEENLDAQRKGKWPRCTQ
uniref:Remorin C-terminal domain-containing protein n=1 Tax=Oryza rufipogon TaxID=4529 RepID=A0A0E0QWK6_ORYRU